MNSTDRMVRVYEIHAPSSPDAQENATVPAVPNGSIPEESPSEPSSPTDVIELIQKLQDPIQKSPWNAVSFSGDGEYILAGTFRRSCSATKVMSVTEGILQRRFREHRWTQSVHMGSDDGRPREDLGGSKGAFD